MSEALTALDEPRRRVEAVVAAITGREHDGPERFDSPAQAMAWFQDNRQGFRALLRVTCADKHYPATFGFADLLRQVYARYNLFPDWRESSGLALHCAHRLGEPDLIARALESRGKYFTQRGVHRGARHAHQAALDIRRELGDRAGEASSLNAIGLVHLREGDAERARDCFGRVRTLMVWDAIDGTVIDEPGKRYWWTIATGNLAAALLDLGRVDEALPLLERALREHETLAEPGARGDVLRCLSAAHRARGDLEEAWTFIARALDLAHGHRNDAWRAHWDMEAGHVLHALGDVRGAHLHYWRSQTTHDQLGDFERADAARQAAKETEPR